MEPSSLSYFNPKRIAVVWQDTNHNENKVGVSSQTLSMKFFTPFLMAENKWFCQGIFRPEISGIITIIISGRGPPGRALVDRRVFTTSTHISTKILEHESTTIYLGCSKKHLWKKNKQTQHGVKRCSYLSALTSIALDIGNLSKWAPRSNSIGRRDQQKRLGSWAKPP